MIMHCVRFCIWFRDVKYKIQAHKHFQNNDTPTYTHDNAHTNTHKQQISCQLQCSLQKWWLNIVDVLFLLLLVQFRSKIKQSTSLFSWNRCADFLTLYRIRLYIAISATNI